MDKDTKTITYTDAEGGEKTVTYDTGLVKIDWRLDWPGRWWLMHVMVEPFGRDHATKGGSYDTGVAIAKDIYGIEAPIPVPYEFVNRTGDTKKMSASRGTGVNAHEITDVLPPEIVRFFMLRSPVHSLLFFDETESLVKLVDDYAAMSGKDEKTPLEEEILYLSQHGSQAATVSSVPFSQLVTAYQASLRDVAKTLETIRRTERGSAVDNEAETITRELGFIDTWLDKWATDETKFNLLETVDRDQFSHAEKKYLARLGQDIVHAPADADGQWFHDAIYVHKDTSELAPRDLFTSLYRALIGKTSGPRAGYFLSVLPRDWLVERLKSFAE